MRGSGSKVWGMPLKRWTQTMMVLSLSQSSSSWWQSEYPSHIFSYHLMLKAADEKVANHQNLNPLNAVQATQAEWPITQAVIDIHQHQHSEHRHNHWSWPLALEQARRTLNVWWLRWTSTGMGKSPTRSTSPRSGRWQNGDYNVDNWWK